MKRKLLLAVIAAGIAALPFAASASLQAKSVDQTINPAYVKTAINTAPVATGTSTGAREAMATAKSVNDAKSGLDIAAAFTNAAKPDGVTVMAATGNSGLYGANYDKVAVDANTGAQSSATTIAKAGTNPHGTLSAATANPASMVSLLN